MGRTVVCDTEGNGLDPTIIWCIVCKDVDSKEVFKFRPADLPEKFLEFAKEVTTWVGHNFIGYDAYSLEKIFNYTISVNNIIEFCRSAATYSA